MFFLTKWYSYFNFYLSIKYPNHTCVKGSMKNQLKLTLVAALFTTAVSFGQFENGLKKNEGSVSISGTFIESTYHPGFKTEIGKDYFSSYATLDSNFTGRAFVSNANASSPSLNYTHWFTKPTSRWTHGVTAGLGFGGLYEIGNSYNKAVRYNLDTLTGNNTNSYAVLDSLDEMDYSVVNEGTSMSVQLGWKLNLALSKHWQLRTGLVVGTNVMFKPTTYYYQSQSSSSETTLFSNDGVQQSTYNGYDHQQEKKEVDDLDLGKLRSSFVVIPLEAHYLFQINKLKSKPVFGLFTAFTSGVNVISYSDVQTASYNWNAHLGLSYYF